MLLPGTLLTITPGSRTSLAEYTTPPMICSGLRSFCSFPPGSSFERSGGFGRLGERPMPYHQGMPFWPNTTPVSAADERRAGGGEIAERVGLQRDEDKILQPEARRVGQRAHPAADGALAVDQRYPLVAHRFQMRAARDHRDLVAARGELRGDVPADRAGAEYADLHAANHRIEA